MAQLVVGGATPLTLGLRDQLAHTKGEQGNSLDSATHLAGVLKDEVVHLGTLHDEQAVAVQQRLADFAHLHRRSVRSAAI